MEPRTTGPRDTSHDDAMRFLFELRQLRAKAGLAPTELAARAHYPHHVIMAAEAGPSLPDLPVLSAYLRGCGAGLADWEERWRSLTGSPAAGLCLPMRPAGCSDLASAGARISAAVPEVKADDQRRIMAAISRAEAAIAAATAPSPSKSVSVSVRQAAPSASGADLAGTDDALAPSTTLGPAEATESAESAEAFGVDEELDSAGTSAASWTDRAVDAAAAVGNHEAIGTVAAAPVSASPAVSAPPGVSASPASALGLSPGAPSAPITAASSRRSVLPHRAAIAATIAAVMCVIAAILLVLR